MGKVVLVVDDNSFMRQMIAGMLKKIPQISVLRAESGDEALVILDAGQVDLVLLDCVMPGNDGFQVLTRIRATPKIAHTLVILVTAHAAPEIIARAQLPESRADGIIAKPLSLATLQAKLKLLFAAREKK